MCAIIIFFFHSFILFWKLNNFLFFIIQDHIRHDIKKVFFFFLFLVAQQPNRKSLFFVMQIYACEMGNGKIKIFLLFSHLSQQFK